MLSGFLYHLRAHGIAVSLTEWLQLMQALALGHARCNLFGLYHTARALLVKKEGLFDTFDRAFASYFEGVEDEFAPLYLHQRAENDGDLGKTRGVEHLLGVVRRDLWIAEFGDVGDNDAGPLLAHRVPVRGPAGEGAVERALQLGVVAFAELGVIARCRGMGEDEYCVDLLIQISAAQGALGRIGQIVLGSHIETCVSEAFERGGKTERQRKIDELMDVFVRYSRIGTR